MLELKNIHKTYSPGTITSACIFEDFSITVPDKQFVSVVGSNGSGKTTMLNIICGSIDIDNGAVEINGEDIAHIKEFKRYKKIGRVYQNPAMGTCGTMTILENLSMASYKGKGFGLSSGINHSKIDEFKDKLSLLGLGLQDKLYIPVHSLSGGQRQALALLMATLTPIDFLILDEHTAALDPKTAEIIMDLTEKIVREKQLTTLMVTHNLRYALQYGDRLLMLHEGKPVLDRKGIEKQNTNIDEVLHIFNDISIECGN